MADNSYEIEFVLAPKQSWFTPAESNNYYATKYDRSGVCLHWWGGGQGADSHDAIVRYFLAQGEQGQKSVNYVVSDRKITLMVNPDMVAWCQQAGNPRNISIECQPTLGPEGYKRLGWLIEQLEQRYGHQLSLHRHSEFFATACCGTIAEPRAAEEVVKWRNKVYDQPPAPAPVPETPPAPTLPDVSPAPLNPNNPGETVQMYTLANAKLVDMRNLSVVKTFTLDTPMEINASATVNGQLFFMTKYAYDHKSNLGFIQSDLKREKTPVVPEPTPTPQPGDPIPPDVTPPTPDPGTVVTPTPDPTPDPTPTPEPEQPQESALKTLLREIWDALKKFWGKA